LAVTQGLPVYQPRTLRKSEAVARMSEWEPDVIVTAAIGFILTPEVLALPSRGTINVHASLLPRWRGAAPIHAALLAGDTETGVTIMCTDEGLDTGPILNQKAMPVHPRDTAPTLHDKLAQLGAELLDETLPRWLAGQLEPRPQPEEGVTLAPIIRKEDGLIQWERTAVEIDRQVRAFTPWPGAYTFWENQRLKIVQAWPITRAVPPDVESVAPPGTIIDEESGPAVVCGEGLLRLVQVQLASKRVVTGPDFVRGRPDLIGARLRSN
jgi:methionyl-tRNA formyltransferase